MLAIGQAVIVPKSKLADIDAKALADQEQIAALETRAEELVAECTRLESELVDAEALAELRRVALEEIRTNRIKTGENDDGDPATECTVCFTGNGVHNWDCPVYIADAVLFEAQTTSAALEAVKRAAKVEALREAAEHCEETELLMPCPEPGTTLKRHGANVCMAMAAELRQLADRLAGAGEGKENGR